MADIADRAALYIERGLDAALQRIDVPNPDDGADRCELCGDDVPPARSALGYSTCITCQEEQEEAP